MRAPLLACVPVALCLSGCPGEIEGTAHDAAAPPATDADPTAPDAAAIPGDAPPTTADAEMWPEHYPEPLTQSPVTPSVVASISRIAATGGPADLVFAKIGDSITVSSSFMHCFAGDHVALDTYDELTATWGYFQDGVVGSTTPYDRDSLAAEVGYAAHQLIAGAPSMLEQELAAAAPRYALVMLGTNDVGYANIMTYGNSMLTIVEQLIASGAVPILSSIPPRDDSAMADALVPRYNAVTRGIAEALQLPYMDFHRELMPLADHGLSGDGVHPSTYSPSAAYRPCVFSPEGLQAGYNVRNLLALTALDRTLAASAGVALDAPALPIRGTGTFADPIVIPGLPFGDRRDTRIDGEARIDQYPACSTANESGTELYYRLELTAAAHLRATVFARESSDIDVHLLSAEGTAASCIGRDDKLVEADLGAGTYYLALDTYVSSAGTLAGPYLLVVEAE